MHAFAMNSPRSSCRANRKPRSRSVGTLLPLLAMALAICLAGSARAARADEADDQYTVAAGHYAAQRWAMSVDEFRKLLHDHPDNSQATKARFFLAEALIQLARYDEAQKEFEAFSASDPHGPHAAQAAFRAGEAAFLSGRHDAARAALNKFRGSYPDDKLNAYALAYLGQLALADNDAATAETMFRQSLADFPKGPTHDECRYGVAKALELKGNSTEAEKLYRQIADGADAGLAESALLRLGLSQSTAGRYPQAIDTLAAFEKKYAASPAISQARLEHARALYQLGQFDPARALLEPLAGDPNAVAARYLLALVQQSTHHHAEALKLLDGLLPGASAEWRPRVELAQATSLIAAEQFSAAATALEGYLQSKPGGDLALRATAQLAVCQARDKRLDAARELYKQIPREPDSANHPSELWLSTTHQLAEAALGAGDLAWSGQLFQSLTAKEIPPEYVVRGLSGLGWCELQANQPEKATATFDRLLEQFPDGEPAAEAAWARGRALERLKKFDAALASYQRILDKYPASHRAAEAMLAAARLHDQLHQTDPALELYARFVAEHPNAAQLDAAHYGWGWTMMDAGRRAEAWPHFQKLHDDYRQSRYWNDATFRLAEGAVEDKQFDKAQSLLVELRAAKPPTDLLPHLLYLEGELAAGRQKWDAVAAAMGQLARDFPDSDLQIPASYWIAEAAYRQGNYDEAGKRLAALADQIAGRHDKWLAMVPLRRAQVLAQQKRWSEAQAMASRIASDFPGFAQQYEADYVVGRALAAQADFEGARREYLQAIHSTTGGKTETAAMAQWMLGETYFHQENYDAALREYLRVEILYAYPRWQAAALLQAGKCQEVLGRPKEAAQLYARLIKITPDTEFTKEGADRLRELQRK